MISRIASAILILLAGCSAPSPHAEQPKPDPTTEAAYLEAVSQLTALNREAEAFLQHGRPDDAAAAITRGQPIEARLLTPSRPTLAAMEAVSDLDDLYARMLLSNGNTGWARMLYQKNVIRWKTWKPPSDEGARRLRQAEDGIVACDRRLKQ